VSNTDAGEKPVIARRKPVAINACIEEPHRLPGEILELRKDPCQQSKRIGGRWWATRGVALAGLNTGRSRALNA
jgi:hypothetical protein